MMSPRRKNNGFTLIELMVALILATIVVAPLYVVTRSLTGQAKLEQVETEAMQRARIGLHTLLNDLAMTGLHASPNPIDDPRSFLFNGDQGDGLNRHAVVHLNPNDTDLSDGEDDSILLVGNFFGGRSYSAIYTGSGEFNTYKPVTGDAALITDEECTLSGFMVRGGYYSYAHVERADGKTLDVPVTDAAFSNGICTVTVDMTGIAENAVTPGDTVYLSPNQAALYRVVMFVLALIILMLYYLLQKANDANRIHDYKIQQLIEFNPNKEKYSEIQEGLESENAFLYREVKKLKEEIKKLKLGRKPGKE